MMDRYEFGSSGWGLGQVAGTCEQENEASGFVRCGEFFTSFLSRILLCGVYSKFLNDFSGNKYDLLK